MCCPVYAVILGAQSFIGGAVAAISLGLVGRRNVEPRLGRNQSISSAGNVAMALGADLIGAFIRRRAIFFFVDGEINGFALDDSTQIRFPPHLSDDVRAVVSEGDRVSVKGHTHTTPKGDIHFKA